MAGAIQTVTFGNLLTAIKNEAKVEGSDNLDAWIGTLINELLLNFCLIHTYAEMLLTNVPLTTVAATESYTLPSNFNFMQRVVYSTTANSSSHPSKRTLLPRNGFVNYVGESGMPRFYEQVGTSLKVMPYLDIPDDDTIYIDYYKYPDLLSNEGEIFPIPRLIAPLKLKAISRTHIYNNSLKQAAVLKGEGMENEARSHAPKK